MRFVIPINVPAGENGSITVHRIDTGTNVARSNKRILREYFIKMGVKANEIKYVMKTMGFWGKALGQ